MPAYSERQHLPYTVEQLFDLVTDIERYPEFLPWCRAARIIEREENGFLGELVIAFSHFTERYTSKVVCTKPDAAGSASIDVTMVHGPFEHLTNRWRFTQGEHGGTYIDFHVDFKFRSRILEKLIGSLFARAAEKMVTAFTKRAEALHGKNV